LLAPRQASFPVLVQALIPLSLEPSLQVSLLFWLLELP
jgi:hypothetical protein